MDGGIPLQRFRVLSRNVDGGCVTTHVAVGIQDFEWFQALGEVPCDTEASREAEVVAAIESLRVNPRWRDTFGTMLPALRHGGPRPGAD